jgi:hypothetical protein
MAASRLTADDSRWRIVDQRVRATIAGNKKPCTGEDAGFFKKTPVG